MSILTPHAARTRFLLMHDTTVSVEKKGHLRQTCMALTNGGADVHTALIETDDDALAFAADAHTNYDAILVAGERRLLDVIDHAALPDVPVGLMQPGALTPLSRATGMRGKAAQIAAALSEGPAFAMDALSITAHAQDAAFARVAVSAGQSAELIDALMPSVVKPLASAMGTYALAKNAARRVSRFDVALDGFNYRCVAVFVLAKRGCGALLPAAEALPQAPLACVLIEADDRTAMFDMLVSARLGRLFRDRSVSVRPAHQVTINGDDVVMQCDGHSIAPTRANRPVTITGHAAARPFIVAQEIGARLVDVTSNTLAA
ncbi:MAG: hypothetical protein AAFZ01_01990 [Pseudomonadota bacterium]